jgi:hypothetical protein
MSHDMAKVIPFPFEKARLEPSPALVRRYQINIIVGIRRYAIDVSAAMRPLQPEPGLVKPLPLPTLASPLEATKAQRDPSTKKKPKRK